MQAPKLSSEVSEAVAVLFHASLLGRTDIIKNALLSLKNAGDFTEHDISNAVSFAREGDKLTALHIAASQGHADAVRALVNAGANLCARAATGEYAGKTPIQVATDSVQQVFVVMLFEQIALGHTEAVSRLLSGGIAADVRDGSSSDDSTLHWACSFGHIEVVRLLLVHGCNVNIRNAHGQLPLHLAVKSCKEDIVALLLLEGASLHAEDSNGKRPIDLLPTSSDNNLGAKVEQLLLSPPAPTMELHNAYLSRLSDAQGSGDDHSSSDSDSEPSQSAEEPETSDSEPSKLMVFWPPVQKQHRRLTDPPLLLRSDENLLVCVANCEMDIFPVLTWSGFLDCMDVYGFQVQVKRTAIGAKFRLCVDGNICPLRHSYQLRCDQEQLLLIAADYTGLLYGMYSIIQMVQLHSQISLKQGIAHIAIPAVEIYDFPAIQQRNVLWSFRHEVRMQQHAMKECVELLSRLRLNTLLLVVDPLRAGETNGALDEHEAKAIESTSTRVYALDEECRRRCVELVPTVIITSVHDKLPLDVLKNFSHSLITLLLDYARPGEGVDVASYAEKCVQSCKTLFKDAQLAGFSTIQVACTKWTQQITRPMELARQVGVIAVEREMSSFFPSKLLIKPIIATQDYVHSMSQYIDEVLASTATYAVLPALFERDYWHPIVIVKYYLCMYAGLCWNSAAFKDMMGEPSARDFYSSLLGEILCLLVYPSYRAIGKAPMNALIYFLTTEWLTLSSSVQGPGSNQQDAIPIGDIARSEKYLWTLATMREEEAASCTIPMDKMALSQCIKFYRTLLSMADWKAHQLVDKQSNDSSLMQFLGIASGSRSASPALSSDAPISRTCNLAIEVEELFVVVNVLYTACKVVLQTNSSCKKYSKQTGNNFSLPTMVSVIPIGVKSDLANSLLESLTGFSFIWRRRFDRHLLDSLKESVTAPCAISVPESNTVKELQLSSASKIGSIHQAPKMPTIAIFRTLCNGLPAPQPLLKYMERIFSQL